MIEVIENLEKHIEKAFGNLQLRLMILKQELQLEEDYNDEEFKYYKFIDDKFSFEELDEGVLSDDDKEEISDIFFSDING